MSYQSYSEKHKRSISPILKTTTEDRKMLHHNKENYILYLEQQLEKTATVVHKKYEERVKGLEQMIQDHDDKIKNFIKLIKLLQNFAETQEQENIKITRHVNNKFEELYHNELRTINKQLHDVQYKVELLETLQIKEQAPLFEEFEQSVNRKIDVLMTEIGQSALKTDYQKLEQRIFKLEETTLVPKQVQESDNKHNVLVEQQLHDLKFLLDNVLKEQETIKTNVQNFHHDLNQQKISSSTLPPRESRKSIVRESRQSEDESIMKPIIAHTSPQKTISKKKVVSTRSTSNKKDKKDKKQQKSLTQQQKNNISVLKKKK